MLTAPAAPPELADYPDGTVLHPCAEWGPLHRRGYRFWLAEHPT